MINKIIYTYWTNKGTDFLCGFQSENAFIKGAKGSLNRSLKITPNVEIWGDIEGKEYLQSHGCEVNFVVVDYDQYTWNKGYWNFPKLITYSLQEEPFLHLDFDVVLFDRPTNLSADIVCEKIRPIGDLTALERDYLPLAIKENYHPCIICSGILGGNNIKVFKKLLEIATPIAQKYGNVSDKNRYILEEVILTVIARLNNISYEAINCNFKHWQGVFAKSFFDQKIKLSTNDLIIKNV